MSADERQARRTEALLLVLALLVLLFGTFLALIAKKNNPGSVIAPEVTGKAVAPAAPININKADAATLARVLGVGPETGKRIVTERTARRNSEGFPDVDSLARIPLVPRAERDAIATRLDAAKTIPADIPGLGKEARAHLMALRAERPQVPWLRLLGAPLITPARLSATESQLIVRPWEEARRALLTWMGSLALFFVLTHFLLRRVYPLADPFLLPLTALLSGLGILLLWSIKDPLRDMPTFVWQAQGVVFGGAVAFLLTMARPLQRLPLHRYGYIYVVAAILGTVLLGALGSGPAGVKLSVGGTQPVEIIKILMVLFLAAYLAERGPLLNDPLRRIGPFPLPRRKDVAPLVVLYALPLALFAIVRDLGPVLLLFGAFLLLVYLATARGVYVVLGLLALLAGGCLGYALKFGVFETRVDMWISPWENAHANGDHLALGLWGLASGGLPGSGLGRGGSGFIPRAGSDLAFASLGEEGGPFAALAVLFCFLAIAIRGVAIARRAGSDFDRLLATGLAGLLALQALVIVAGTLGLLPLTGITLPFVSYGKSSLVASFLIVGLLLGLSGRAAPQTPGAALSRLFLTASRRLVVCLSLLFAITAVRLLWIQTVQADVIAARPVRVPDADGIKRPHINPRLLALANRIPRGRLLDRAGRVLATTRASDGKRIYPLGSAAGHLVGYLNPAVGGPAGFEDRYSLELRGFASYRALLPLWRAKDLPGFQLPKGKDVVLSLDASLQQVCLEALQQRTAGLRDRRNGKPKRRGAVVVLDVATGEVLAAATLPTYDPNILTVARMKDLQTNASEDYPLINRALSGYYPPGSTFKIVTASALFSSSLADYTRFCGHVDSNIIWTAGGKTYARRRIVDDEGERPHGLTNLTLAIAESCNIYFAHAGLKLGPEGLREHAARYGFTKLPTATEFNAALPEIGFGQGEMLATPMEMAGVALTVASGGKRLRPQFLKGMTPEATDTPLSSANAARLAEMMRRVTISGTAANRFDDLPFAVAGKTGTAQNDRYDRAPHSWFIGFAPVDRPRVAFAVVVENGGYGSQVAVPIVHDVLSNIR